MSHDMQARLEAGKEFALQYHRAECFSNFTMDEAMKGCALVTCLLGEVMAATDRGEEFDPASAHEIVKRLELAPSEVDGTFQVVDIFLKAIMSEERMR